MCKLLDSLVNDRRCWVARLSVWTYVHRKWMWWVLAVSSAVSVLLS